jgi:hypothetical protein
MEFLISWSRLGNQKEEASGLSLTAAAAAATPDDHFGGSKISDLTAAGRFLRRSK